MGRFLLFLDRYPSLRKRAFRGMAAEPELFARLLGNTPGRSFSDISGGHQFALRLAVPDRVNQKSET